MSNALATPGCVTLPPSTFAAVATGVAFIAGSKVLYGVLQARWGKPPA